LRRRRVVESLGFSLRARPAFRLQRRSPGSTSMFYVTLLFEGAARGTRARATAPNAAGVRA
jgi:hypothetical protein